MADDQKEMNGAGSAFSLESFRGRVARFDEISDEDKEALIRDGREIVRGAPDSLKQVLLELARRALYYQPTELYGMSLINDIIDEHEDCALLVAGQAMQALRSKDTVSNATYVLAIGLMIIKSHPETAGDAVMNLCAAGLESKQSMTQSMSLQLAHEALKINSSLSPQARALTALAKKSRYDLGDQVREIQARLDAMSGQGPGLSQDADLAM